MGQDSCSLRLHIAHLGSSQRHVPCSWIEPGEPTLTCLINSHVLHMCQEVAGACMAVTPRCGAGFAAVAAAARGSFQRSAAAFPTDLLRSPEFSTMIVMQRRAPRTPGSAGDMLGWLQLATSSCWVQSCSKRNFGVRGLLEFTAHFATAFDVRGQNSKPDPRWWYWLRPAA